VIRYREPTVEDGKHLWRLARDSGNLDLNSPYTYLMLAHYFADSCIVAESDGEVVGFIVGFRMPPRPSSVFVWQVTSAPSQRGKGLATSMMGELLRRHAASGGTHLEATVTPSNTASQRLFRGVATRLGVGCEETPEFSRDHFPGDDHEEEVLFRIGPFNADDVQRAFGGATK
jgi:L-2,4-diaminobutyric acid acetyltransferase